MSKFKIDPAYTEPLETAAFVDKEGRAKTVSLNGKEITKKIGQVAVVIPIATDADLQRLHELKVPYVIEVAEESKPVK